MTASSLKHFLNVSIIESQKARSFFVINSEQVNFEICLVKNLHFIAKLVYYIFYKINFIGM